MAKKTALELSQRGAQRQGLDIARVGVSVGIGALLALAVGCFAQAFSVWREDAANVEVDALRERVVAELGGFIAQRQAGLTKALEDPELRAALATPGVAGFQRATVRLKQLMPDAVRIEFYAPELDELLEADLATFGYARANILAEARSGGDVARAQAHKDEHGNWLLALGQGARDADRLLAWTYVTLPPGPVLEVFGGESLAFGRIELRQGAMSGSSLATLGGRATADAEEQQFAVPHSIFTVVTQHANLFKVGSVVPPLDVRSPIGLGIAGLVLLGAAAALLGWRRRAPPPAGGAGVPVEKPGAGPAQSLAQRLAKLAGQGKDAAGSAPGADDAVMPAALPSAPPKPPAPAPATPSRAANPVAIDRSIFRAYDIRGVIGKTLTPEVARAIGQAVGTLVKERGLREVVVGRDGRLSGPELAAALMTGLRSTGCDVIDIGQVPTPVVYFATYHLNTGSGVMVTGSHNPPDYNGFKIVVGGETLAEEQIQDLYGRIAEGRLASGPQGGLQVMSVGGDYIERIIGDVQVERRLKLVVDAGNGVAGAFAPQVLEGIGCEVVPLHCEVDGTFPNHHPDPSDPANLQDLIVSVKRMQADLGLAFDGDGDRLGVVTASGEVIYPDRLLMLFATDVLDRNPGAAIIYDVKCTGHLQDVILRHGGSPIMWKTGHSLIKAKMREEDAELAGEMSGHFFFRERWFGFDDGIYAAARLCEILGASDRAPQAVFDDLPKGVSTPELKVSMAEGAHYAFIGRFKEKASFPGARVSTIDGIRADYPDGWGLVRCSNTTPSLVLRFDANDATALARIQDTFRAQILAVDPALKLPF